MGLFKTKSHGSILQKNVHEQKRKSFHATSYISLQVYLFKMNTM